MFCCVSEARSLVALLGRAKRNVLPRSVLFFGQEGWRCDTLSLWRPVYPARGQHTATRVPPHKPVHNLETNLVTVLQIQLGLG